MDKIIKIIGIGMDGAKTLTKEARDAIESANLIAGAGRMMDICHEINKSADIFQSYKAVEIKECIEEANYKEIVIAVSGDTGFFSLSESIVDELNKSKLIEEYDISVVPGISSLSYACAKAGISYQDMKIINLHNSEDNTFACKIRRNRKSFLLLGSKYSMVKDIAKRLIAYNLQSVKMFLFEKLSDKDEKITEGSPIDFIDYEEDKLSCMIVINEKADDAYHIGLPDDTFITGEVPITKQDIRAAVISKLCIKPDSIIWDLGCGTGSVSIEAGLLAYNGCIHSVDKNPEAVFLTDTNAKLFSLDNIKIYEANIDDVVDTLLEPDIIFIGGSGKSIESTLDKINSRGIKCHIVLTAIMIETAMKAVNKLDSFGIDTDITMYSVSKSKKVSEGHMMLGTNPIYVISTK